MSNLLGSKPFATNLPIAILSQNNDINKKLIVEKILTKLISKKTDLRILKGPTNSETRSEKYIGICGTNTETGTGALTLCTSETTSLFTIEPTKKYDEPIDTLRGIISGRDSIRLVKSKNNDHNSTGTYFGLATYGACQTPSCVMLDKAETLRRASQDTVTSVEARKQDRTKFKLEVQQSTNGENEDDDIDVTIYRVFTGQCNVRLKKAKGNFPSARGTYLGLCDSKIEDTPCKTPILSLIDDYNKSQFRIHAMDLFHVSCCLGDNKDSVACGLFSKNTHLKCDSVVTDYCKSMNTKDVPACSCLFSQVPKANCFDTICKKYGYKTKSILDDTGEDCGVNEPICYLLTKQRNNPNIDKTLYTEACSNYTDKNYADYVFNRYWIPILLIIGLGVLVLGFFNYDYKEKKKYYSNLYA